MSPPVEHGVSEIYRDNIGEGFRGTCLCGWETDLSNTVQDIGEQFDEHFAEQGIRK